MHWQFVIAGYTIVFGAMAAYAAAVIRQGRSLSRRVPAERRRFLD
jgi:hypothetical protein